MEPDSLKQIWQAQSPRNQLTADPELLLKELERNQRKFTATIFWRDVREVGTSLGLVPIWLCVGLSLSLPWSWYLTVPALVWIAGFMLLDRMRHKRSSPEACEPLRQCVTSSLTQIEHQIWLLRNVLWWYLLPLAISLLAFFAQVSWQQRSGGWLTALVGLGALMIVVVVFVGVYRVNQTAVRSMLIPRRQELEALLNALADE